MKFDKIKTLKILKSNILRCLILLVLSKNLLHIDTPECQVEYRGIGARVMAKQRREEREAQMEAASLTLVHL